MRKQQKKLNTLQRQAEELMHNDMKRAQLEDTFYSSFSDALTQVYTQSALQHFVGNIARPRAQLIPAFSGSSQYADDDVTIALLHLFHNSCPSCGVLKPLLPPALRALGLDNTQVIAVDMDDNGIDFSSAAFLRDTMLQSGVWDGYVPRIFSVTAPASYLTATTFDTMDQIISLDTLNYVPIEIPPGRVTYDGLLGTLRHHLRDTALLSSVGKMSALGDAVDNIEYANMAQRSMSSATKRASHAIERANDFDNIGDIVQALAGSNLSGDTFAQDIMKVLKGTSSMFENDPRSRQVTNVMDAPIGYSILDAVSRHSPGVSNLDYGRALVDWGASAGMRGTQMLSAYPSDAMGYSDVLSGLGAW